MTKTILLPEMEPVEPAFPWLFWLPNPVLKAAEYSIDWINSPRWPEVISMYMGYCVWACGHTQEQKDARKKQRANRSAILIHEGNNG